MFSHLDGEQSRPRHAVENVANGNVLGPLEMLDFEKGTRGPSSDTGFHRDANVP